VSSDFVCMGRKCLAILFVWAHSVEHFCLYGHTVPSDFVSMGTQCLAVLFVWAQSA